MRYSFILREENREKLQQEGLYFSVQGESRGNLKDKPVFFTELSAFNNAAVLGGNTVPQLIGAYSYSWTGLPPDIKIGNYCSIAHGLSIMGVAHPYRAFTTSSVGYDPNFAIMKNAKLQKNSRKLVQDWKRILRIGNDVWCGGG